MSYEQLRDQIDCFDDLISELNLRVDVDCLIGSQFAVVREFLRDWEDKSQEEWLPQWQSRFREWHDSVIVVKRITDAIHALLPSVPKSKLRKYLKTLLAGSLTQDFRPDQAKDFFYELELAARFVATGFTVELGEPDIVLSGNGLNAPFGVACKFPSSEAQIHSHLSKGYSQLSKNNLTGLVAIGLDQIVFKELVHFIDFREGDEHPLEVLQGRLTDAIRNLVSQRSKLYPAEDPVDGAILTLWAYGVYGDPAHMTLVGAVQLQCDANNPRMGEFSIIYEALKSDIG